MDHAELENVLGAAYEAQRPAGGFMPKLFHLLGDQSVMGAVVLDAARVDGKRDQRCGDDADDGERDRDAKDADRPRARQRHGE